RQVRVPAVAALPGVSPRAGRRAAARAAPLAASRPAGRQAAARAVRPAAAPVAHPAAAQAARTRTAAKAMAPRMAATGTAIGDTRATTITVRINADSRGSGATRILEGEFARRRAQTVERLPKVLAWGNFRRPSGSALFHLRFN